MKEVISPRINLGESVRVLLDKSIKYSVPVSLMFTAYGSVHKSVWTSVMNSVHNPTNISL
jgi:hypothetical protein